MESRLFQNQNNLLNMRNKCFNYLLRKWLMWFKALSLVQKKQNLPHISAYWANVVGYLYLSHQKIRVRHEGKKSFFYSKQQIE